MTQHTTEAELSQTEPDRPGPSASAGRSAQPTLDRRLRIRWFDFSLPILAPPLVFIILRVELYFEQNGLDPFMYLGYAQEPTDLISRYGLTYYSVRFGLLWPIGIFQGILGAEAGHLGLRWVLAALAGGSLFALFRRIGGRWLGTTMMLAFLVSPVVLRALMTSYSDSTSVPYLTIGGCLLLLSRGSKHRALILAVAGLAFGLTIHSNPFGASIVAVTVAAWAVVEVRDRRWGIVRDAACLAIPVLGLTALGMIVYQVRYGDWNILRPSWETARALSGEAGQGFRSATHAWLGYHTQIYVPVLVMAAWVAVVVGAFRRTRRESVQAMLALVGVAGFFVFHQFVMDSVTLETYYYSSLLVPSTLIAAGFVIDALARRAGHRIRVYALAATLLVGLPLVRNIAWDQMEITRWPWVPIFGVATVLTAASATRSRAAAVASVALLISSSFLFVLGAPRAVPRGSLYHPTYHLALGNSEDRTGIDLYGLSSELMEVTPDLDGRSGHLMFWVNPTNIPWIVSVLGPFVASHPVLSSGMPNMDEGTLNRLRDENVDRLVLLGGSTAELDDGRAALASAGVTFRADQPKLLRYGQFELQYQLLRTATVHHK